jgi:succinate dehydrogenase / fumarate reductase, flavoprotein subunit
LEIYELIDKVIETDILIVGGGGAASNSAVSARRSGMNVTLVSKGKLGKSGNSIMAHAAFSMDGKSAHDIYGIKEADASFTRDRLFEKIVKQSYYLSDQNVVEQFVEDSPAVIHEFVEWGRKAGQNFKFTPPSYWETSGRSIGNAIRKSVEDTEGIEIIEDTMIVDILTYNNRVAGALGIDIYSGDLILFKAKAVILATGGYQPFSLKCTNSDMTGDGMAMAYRAGAKLADMEFLLFIQVALEPESIRGSILPFMFSYYSFKMDIKDAEGNSILDEIPQEIKTVTDGNGVDKLVQTYYQGKRLFLGKGTAKRGLFLDFLKSSKEELERDFDKLTEMFATWHKHGYYNGDDIGIYRKMAMNGESIEVSIGNEYSMGGILVDEKMQTDVMGLFAAGEVTSGLSGACRVADALTEMLTQGNRAGRSAAEYAKFAAEIEIDSEQLKNIVNRILKLFENTDGISAIKVCENIEKAADEGFNYCRTEESLMSTLEEIERIKNKELPNIYLKNATCNYNYEWIKAVQAENTILCTEIGVRAALMRKESRGTHIRLDYPAVDNDNWLVRIIACDRKGKIKLSVRKPIVTKMQLPQGKEDSIVKYLLKFKPDIGDEGMNDREMSL